MEAAKQFLLATMLVFLATACHYDEDIELCNVTVQLVYPDDSVEPYAGVRVELKDALASIFVDSTDTQGTAHFNVPSGIYEASSNTQLVTYDWRYNFNGVKSLIIISPDSTNHIVMKLKMSKKRIVH